MASFLWLIFALSLGCGGLHQTYPGDARPTAETVRIQAEKGRFQRFDGTSVFVAEVETLPGEHEFQVVYVRVGDELGANVRDEDRARLTCRGRLLTVAGERYRVRVRPSRRKSRNGPNLTRFETGIEVIETSSGRRISSPFRCSWESTDTALDRPPMTPPAS